MGNPLPMARGRRTSRIAGALLAFGLTLLPLLALYAYRPIHVGVAWADERSFLPILQFKPLPRPEAQSRPVLKPIQNAKAQVSPEPLPFGKPSENPPALMPATIGLPPAASAEPDPAMAPASAPLRLDRSVIRTAAQAAKTDLQTMAEASGTYIGDKPISQAEKLAKGVARSEKPDCFGPQTGGAGLLAVVIIPIMVMTDKCK